jgi:hypothetical protein
MGVKNSDAEESVELPNGGPMIQGKTNIAKGMSFLADNNNRLIGAPVGADPSSGRSRVYLGQARAITHSTQKTKPGRRVVEYRKYTSI